MTDQLIMTTAEREQLQNTLKQCWHTVSPETDPLIASSEALLQSLPMVSGEPVAWRRYEEAFNCHNITANPKVSTDKSFEPLFTSPQALTKISADDVTDEMLDAYFVEYASDGTTTWRDCDPSIIQVAKKACASIVDSVINHRSEAR